MNIAQIRYFLALAEAGSFTKAAERANVTQPTLSAGIRRLEEDLGAPLFDRGRGAALTPDGARFLPRARVMLQEWTAARRELGVTKPARQRLRFGHAPGLPGSGLSDLLGSFCAAHPDVALETLEAPAASLLKRLQLGRIDLALLVQDGERAGFSNAPVFRQRYRLALPARHPLAHRATLRMQDLHNQPFAIWPAAPIMPEAERLFDSHHVRPRIVGRTESDTALLALVQAGIALALLPSWLLAAAGDAVASQPLAELRITHQFALLWRDPAPAPVQLLISHAAGRRWESDGMILGR